ncbi:MAG: hypothetical protein ABI051_01870 [Vicinamibacterales bacterium]
MDTSDPIYTSSVAGLPVWLWWGLAAVAAILVLVALMLKRKSRRLPGPHVFQASRWSRGNRLLPAQVAITPESITLYQPQWIGKLEESIHISHVASIKIDTNMIFSDVFIETTGGRNPIVCHGHTKGDAVKMKQVIEQFQSTHYRPA